MLNVIGSCCLDTLLSGGLAYSCNTLNHLQCIIPWSRPSWFRDTICCPWTREENCALISPTRHWCCEASPPLTCNSWDRVQWPLTHVIYSVFSAAVYTQYMMDDVCLTLSLSRLSAQDFLYFFIHGPHNLGSPTVLHFSFYIPDWLRFVFITFWIYLIYSSFYGAQFVFIQSIVFTPYDARLQRWYYYI